jgi:peptidoglycan/LPS O-acetylase OafA/YrhL
MATTMDKPRRSGSEDKLLGIELLRFASALAVLVFHYQHLAFVGTQQVNFEPTLQPFYSLLSFFYRYGFHGVQVFWCISGFIFFWKYGETVSAKRLDGYSFFVLRLSRLYPLHFVTLIFVALTQLIYFNQHGDYYVYHFNDLYHFVLQLFMASNWGMQVGDSFNGPIWSISVEVLIYAIFFLSLRYISGSVFAIAAMAAIGAAVKVLHISSHPIFECAMFFYVGCLTAILYARVRHSPQLKKLVALAALIGIVGLTTLQFFIQLKPIYFLLVFSPALIFLFTAYIQPGRQGGRILESLGSVTYSSYLLHVPIQIAIMIVCTWLQLAVPFYNAAFFLAFMAVTLAISFWCYKAFEVPAQNFLRRKLMRSPVRTAAAVQANP